MKKWLLNKIMGAPSTPPSRDRTAAASRPDSDEPAEESSAPTESPMAKSVGVPGRAAPKHHFNKACIKVIGVGGGGGNAINSMISSGVQGIEFIAANTDLQALNANLAPVKIPLGDRLTSGLGAGAKPEIGRDAALEDTERLRKALKGADMVFVTAGMGGGTGTGAAPVISAVAREIGALTVGVVTKPFSFEGRRRMRQAIEGIDELTGKVDTLITIPNEKLLSVVGHGVTALDAFKLADDVLVSAVRGISDLMVVNGFINVDFADVKAIMQNMGKALMTTGQGSGEDRAMNAARQAISSPLLEDQSIDGATGILINITGGPSLTLTEINQAASLIHEVADPDANIIFGSAIDPTLGEEIRITVIATGVNLGTVSHDTGSEKNEGKAAPSQAQPAKQAAPAARPRNPVAQITTDETLKKQPRTLRAIPPTEGVDEKS